MPSGRIGWFGDAPAPDTSEQFAVNDCDAFLYDIPAAAYGLTVYKGGVRQSSVTTGDPTGRMGWGVWHDDGPSGREPGTFLGAIWLIEDYPASGTGIKNFMCLKGITIPGSGGLWFGPIGCSASSIAYVEAYAALNNALDFADITGVTACDADQFVDDPGYSDIGSDRDFAVWLDYDSDDQPGGFIGAARAMPAQRGFNGIGSTTRRMWLNRLTVSEAEKALDWETLILYRGNDDDEWDTIPGQIVAYADDGASNTPGTLLETFPLSSVPNFPSAVYAADELDISASPWDLSSCDQYVFLGLDCLFGAADVFEYTSCRGGSTGDAAGWHYNETTSSLPDNDTPIDDLSVFTPADSDSGTSFAPTFGLRAPAAPVAGQEFRLPSIGGRGAGW